MQNRYITSILTFVIMSSPIVASADTASEIQIRIQSLLEQVKTLQQQLVQLTASTTGNVANWMASSTMMFGEKPGRRLGECLEIGRNLRGGERGDDIRKLQDMLRSDERVGFMASSTGVFGPQTMRAMARFQQLSGIASSTSGIVGPRTRKFFVKQCMQAKRLETNRPQIMSDEREDDNAKMIMVAGNVTSNNGSSITVSTDNGIKTVYLTATTSITIALSTSTPPTKGVIADLTNNLKVRVIGTPNGDGSISAINVMAGMVALQIMEQRREQMKPLQLQMQGQFRRE